jgi:hypothetical protein
MELKQNNREKSIKQRAGSLKRSIKLLTSSKTEERELARMHINIRETLAYITSLQISKRY